MDYALLGKFKRGLGHWECRDWPQGIWEGSMRFNHKPRQIQTMEVERMKTFSDSIFAFAMTLLVTRIVLPDIPADQVGEQLPAVMLQSWRHFAMYAISFLGIGGYWVLHHLIFNIVQYSDRLMIWLNLLFLLTVTFLPLPTGLMGKYGRDSYTATLYGITISLNYALLLLVCLYACSDERYLKPDVDRYTRRLLILRVAAPLVFALIGTGLSFFYFRLSFVVYFLVVIVNALPLTRIGRRLRFLESEMLHPSA